MNKAFTKEDEDVPEPPSVSASLPTGPFHLTATGARRLASTEDARIRDALAKAQVLPPQRDPERAAIGVTVRLRRGRKVRDYRLVSPEERALTGDGCSVRSPLGIALLGARVGDVVEIEAPSGDEEAKVVALTGEDAGG